jgi:hypothetical protein
LVQAQGDGPRRRASRDLDRAQLSFFGLVFILPGVVGPNLPSSFTVFASYLDFATGMQVILALVTARIRPLFWFSLLSIS